MEEYNPFPQDLEEISGYYLSFTFDCIFFLASLSLLSC